MVEKHPIDKLTIEGFMSIRKVDIELRNLNVLIGPNGAGKSNLISYFHMLREMVEGRLQSWISERGGSDRILSYGIKETEELRSRIDFGANGYGFILKPDVDGKLFFEEESLLYSGGYDEGGLPLGSGHFEAKLKSEIVPNQWRRADYCYVSIVNWKVFHFHDTSDSAPVKRRGELQDNEYLRRDAANLAPYLYKLRQDYPGTYSLIRKIVRLAIPFFDDFVLRPVRTQANVDEFDIQLLWHKKDSDYPFRPSQLSDGSIRFMCLVTALLQPEPPSTIIIDEPELGLHPYAITLLGALIRSASARMQVIVATQSVPFLNEFSINDLLIVEREDGASVFRRHNENEFENWLEDYTIGELWEKNVLGGRPH
jgi:predicted ATPase